jgi:hypothetical protein
MTGIRADTSMGLSIVRILALGLGGLLILTGLGIVVATPLGVVAALPALVSGGIVVVAVLVERMRYRSEAAERTGNPPGPGGGESGPIESRFVPTNERFVDPTSGHTMRVFVDANTGERRYRAEE